MIARTLVLAAAVGVAAGSLHAQTAPASPQNAPQALEKDAPTVAQNYSKTAMAALAAGDLAAAESGFKKVLLLVPDNIPTMLNLGLVAYRKKDYDGAETLLKKTTRLAPENGLPWLMLGIVYYEQDKLDGALAALAQAVLYAPKDPRTHHYLGVTVGKKGWNLAAEDELRKAIALDQNYGEAHFNLAVFYLERKPPLIELARRHYERSVELGGAADPEIEKRLAAPADAKVTPVR